MPLVSVIIPTYNRGLVVSRAIGSVLRQSFTDYELIVVDDGSTDMTAAVLSRFEPRVGIVFQDNTGVAAARNAGLRTASGELIAFLDSDDEWLPQKLAAQVAMFKDAGPEFVCHTGEIWLRNGQPVAQKRVHRKQGGRFFARALERCLISPSSVMISRVMFERVGMFDETMPAAEDYDLWLRITAFHEVRFIPEQLVIKHADTLDQLSMTVPAIDRYRITAIMKILRDPELPREHRSAALAELGRKCRIMAAGSTKRGRQEEARYYLELARNSSE